MSAPTLGLVPHPTKNIDDSLAIIRERATAIGGRLVCIEEDAPRVGPGVETLPEDRFLAEVDALIALGGDGTMLGAMRLVSDRPVPVLGVNYGNLGFLVEVEPNELPAALDRLISEDFQIEPHHALDVVLEHVDGSVAQTFLAFNDVAIARRPGEGVVSADLHVEDTPYGYFKADGIVVSTPAGSTAYNYAAGGPVLSPSLVAAVVSPVAPMSGIDRSVVLGEGEPMRFDLGAGTRRAAVEVDGRLLADVTEGDVLRIRLRADAGMIVRLDAGRHQAKGRLKLSLLDLPLRKDQLLELVPPEIRARAAELR